MQQRKARVVSAGLLPEYLSLADGVVCLPQTRVGAYHMRALPQGAVVQARGARAKHGEHVTKDVEEELRKAVKARILSHRQGLRTGLASRSPLDRPLTADSRRRSPPQQPITAWSETANRAALPEVSGDRMASTSEVQRGLSGQRARLRARTPQSSDRRASSTTASAGESTSSLQGVRGTALPTALRRGVSDTYSRKLTEVNDTVRKRWNTATPATSHAMSTSPMMTTSSSPSPSRGTSVENPRVAMRMRGSTVTGAKLAPSRSSSTTIPTQPHEIPLPPSSTLIRETTEVLQLLGMHNADGPFWRENGLVAELISLSPRQRRDVHNIATDV